MEYKVVVKVKLRTKGGDVIDRDLLAIIDATNQLDALKPALVTVFNSLLHAETKPDRIHVIDVSVKKLKTFEEFAVEQIEAESLEVFK
jgi:hypothetical protein